MTKKNKVTPENLGEKLVESVEQVVKDVVSYPEKAITLRVRMDKGRAKYDICEISYNDHGQCTEPKVICTEINESTAIIKLIKASHETFDIKVIRDKLRELKGSK